MRYRLISIVGTLWLGCGSLMLAQADRIDGYLKVQMIKEHIPAVSLAIVRDGRIVKLKSYGLANPEWETSSTPDTTFQLASATKLLTGTALMRHVEQG